MTMTDHVSARVSPYLGTLEESTAQWFLGNQVWQRAGGAQTDGEPV